MATQLITASYSDALTVKFTRDAWFNATLVAKHFNKKPVEWLRLESTIAYLKHLVEFQRWDNPTFDENQLVIVKKGSPENGGGTWFHPKLAVAFARWLDARFAVWCDLQIEKILHSAPTNDTLAEFLKLITETITIADFNWRKQALSTAYKNLEKAQVSMTFTVTVSGKELLA